MTPAPHLVLASASPRRREILASAGFRFEVRPAQVDESPRAGESPDVYVQRLAEAKARAAGRPGELTLGADTTVVIDGESLGKPVDEADARRMLRRLSGRAHQVLTGYSLFDGQQSRTAVESTTVHFTDLSDKEIAVYVASGEPLDKAGAYGIQGLASSYIRRIEGCYFNVVGLPAAALRACKR